LEVSGAKGLNGLEGENARLKKLLAAAMFDNVALTVAGGGKQRGGTQWADNRMSHRRQLSCQPL
jgi:hypothetical protein